MLLKGEVLPCSTYVGGFDNNFLCGGIEDIELHNLFE